MGNRRISNFASIVDSFATALAIRIQYAPARARDLTNSTLMKMTSNGFQATSYKPLKLGVTFHKVLQLHHKDLLLTSKRMEFLNFSAR